MISELDDVEAVPQTNEISPIPETNMKKVESTDEKRSLNAMMKFILDSQDKLRGTPRQNSLPQAALQTIAERAIQIPTFEFNELSAEGGISPIDILPSSINSPVLTFEATT